MLNTFRSQMVVAITTVILSSVVIAGYFVYDIIKSDIDMYIKRLSRDRVQSIPNIIESRRLTVMFQLYNICETKEENKKNIFYYYFINDLNMFFNDIAMEIPGVIIITDKNGDIIFDVNTNTKIIEYDDDCINEKECINEKIRKMIDKLHDEKEKNKKVCSIYIENKFSIFDVETTTIDSISGNEQCIFVGNDRFYAYDRELEVLNEEEESSGWHYYAFINETKPGAEGIAAFSEMKYNIKVLPLVFIVLIFSFSVFVLIFLASMLTNPLVILSRKMKKVHQHDFTGDDHSELLDGLPVVARNEAGQLAETFSFMISKLSANIKKLVETTAANERMEADLDVARTIQLGSLPKIFSFPPEKKIELHADMFPAREVGGDLYDFFLIGEKHICIAIGDVVGKGVSAALTMTIAKKLIGSTVLQKGRLQSPSEIASHLNEILVLDNPDFYYTTLFFGILDVTTGELRYVNCGHSPQPLFTNGGNTPFFRKEVSGPPVGSMPGISYKEFATVLPPGEAILLCTDGVTEAMNEEEQLFGDKRLLENFARMQDKPCKEVIDGILREVRAHAGQEPQSDDITMLMIRWGAE